MEGVIEFRNAELPAIERGVARAVDLQVQATSAVKIARLARAVADAATRLRERRDRLVEEYAQRDADGRYILVPNARGQRMIRIDTDRAAEFETALEAILDEKITMPGAPLWAADLRRTDGTLADLPASVFLDLGPLFDGDDDID